MPTQTDLIREKNRYGLEPRISSQELAQLAQGVPVQKIIGYIEMADVKIKINHKVLIPRYETEELILLISQFIKNQNTKILDIGTGSGFIAIALAKKFANAQITAIDIDKNAILQTQENCQLNNVKVNILESNLFSNVSGKYDIIVSNPPYLNITEISDVLMFEHEPFTALVADDDGLEFYKKIINEAKQFLNQNGYLFFEINHRHSQFFRDQNFTIIKDINSHNRFAYKQFKG